MKTLIDKHNLKSSRIDTSLGPMLAIADEEALYLLEFTDRLNLEKEIKRMRQKTQRSILPGSNQPIDSIQEELTKYFAGSLTIFQTPLFLFGTPFQQSVWKELQKIPFGETRSYSDMACAIQHPSARRAAARANGANQLAIIIPCHRVINTNGNIGGYAGGVERKTWLLNHEKSATVVHSSQDANERGKPRSKRSDLNEENMAKAMFNEEDQSGKATAVRTPNESMTIVEKSKK